VTSEAFGVDASAYTSHQLHSLERVWPETNCYVDLWVELLHALGLAPMAVMAFTVAMDFEGDQWTFFKPSLDSIHELYGIDVQELAIWRPLRVQVAEQIEMGRVPLVEVDAFHLPDTSGVSYGIEHTKTTVGAQAIDLAARKLGYFHGPGYFELDGADFDGIFAVGKTAMAPYTEIAKLDRRVKRSAPELRLMAGEQLKRYLRRVPESNPVTRYRARYMSDIQWLAGEDMPVFYKYAFATLRQCGACAELAGSYLEWLSEGTTPTVSAAASFHEISSAAKAMQFKLARMMATRKPADVAPMLDRMEACWEGAMADLAASHGT
jgi:hypothetical protein